ncbi:cytidine deaminase [Corynebacterium pyruviciproducens]|uniref:cytidine deaminase n=1 Tax=Corynebacterium pyruviciproducens TaxID=598660 RepID=UPI00254C33BF|nr:cytidine deaminase [Corynebacterium pyruviciproducens]MDK7214201.1 cytidine deaminase [Corynebacterium pyruviciproducens]
MKIWEKNELLREVNRRCRAGGSAAGVRTSSGRIIAASAIGPLCAETIVLAQAREADPYGRVTGLLVMEDGEVVAPCGACRQHILDLDPTIEVVVAGEAIVTARDLLPFARVPATATGATPRTAPGRETDEQPFTSYVSSFVAAS